MGYTTKNRTFRTGDLKDANVSVIGDGYNASAQYTGVDGYGNLWVTTHEGTPQHFNGTVGPTPIDITLSTKSTALLIRNPRNNSNNDLLQVSFDGGTNYFNVERRASLQLETEVSSFRLRSNNAGTQYQIIVTRIVEAVTD